MSLVPDDFEVQPLDTIPIKGEEARHQAALVAALRRHWSVIADVALRPVVIHLPLGGSRDSREAGNLKVQGATAGTPDLALMFPSGKIIWLEMKAAGGKLSPLQVAFHSHLVALGHTVLVAYSVFDALAQLRKVVK